MICKAKYAKKSDIPEGLEDEFELKGGEYWLKESAIDDGEAIFASGAVANKDRALKQLKDKKDEVRDLKEEITGLNQKLETAGSKDGLVLSKDDAAAWAEYQKLGSVKDVSAIVTEFPGLKAKLSNIEETDGLSQFVKETGLNLDVLKDWKFDAIKGAGIEFFTKDDIQKIKGVDTKVKVPMVRLKEKQEGSNEVKISEEPLLDVAKKRLSSYQVAALTQKSENQPNTNILPDNSNNSQQQFYIPSLGSGDNQNNNSGGEKKEKPVDKFNKERDEKPSPFDPPKS